MGLKFPLAIQPEKAYFVGMKSMLKNLKHLVPLFLLLFLSSPVHASTYEDGLEAARAGDLKAAYEIFHTLAEQGDLATQFVLGKMHSNGRGVPKDYLEAVKWYKLAAEQGLAQAQYELAMLYGKSDSGVPSNNEEAVKWMKLAAEQGHGQAQYFLGVAYNMGRGVEQDNKEAVKWWTLSADQGVAKSQIVLAAAYIRGAGVDKDFVQAHKWFGILVANGEEKLRQYRDNIETVMTPEQLAESRKLTQAWLEEHPK